MRMTLVKMCENMKKMELFLLSVHFLMICSMYYFKFHLPHLGEFWLNLTRNRTKNDIKTVWHIFSRPLKWSRYTLWRILTCNSCRIDNSSSTWAVCQKSKNSLDGVCNNQLSVNTLGKFWGLQEPNTAFFNQMTWNTGWTLLVAGNCSM